MRGRAAAAKAKAKLKQAKAKAKEQESSSAAGAAATETGGQAKGHGASQGKGNAQRQGERQELVPRGRLRRPHAIGTAGGREGRALTPGAYVVSTASSPPTGTTTQPSNWRSL